MRYLGIDYFGYMTSIGVYDGVKKEFCLRKFKPMDRLMSKFIVMHGKTQNILTHNAVKYYQRLYLSKILKKIPKVDMVVLAGYSGIQPCIENLKYLTRKFNGIKVLRSDHLWGHINSAKAHPKFEYPALILDGSAQHTVLVYLPDNKKAVVLAESHPKVDGTYECLGKIIINLWQEELKEEVYWPEVPVKGKRNIYELYSERGAQGKVVVDMKKEINKSKKSFCDDVIKFVFVDKMCQIRGKYRDEEKYRNDWVASQHQMLRDIAVHIRDKEKKRRTVKTFFISGGISRNPAFLGSKEWFLVPNHLAGDDGAGCFMAYLGYLVNEEGLVIEHDRWKNIISNH